MRGFASRRPTAYAISIASGPGTPGDSADLDRRRCRPRASGSPSTLASSTHDLRRAHIRLAVHDARRAATHVVGGASRILRQRGARPGRSFGPRRLCASFALSVKSSAHRAPSSADALSALAFGREALVRDPRRRDRLLARMGYRVLRLGAELVEQQLHQAVDQVRAALGQPR
jgi:hypothetical protein